MNSYAKENDITLLADPKVLAILITNNKQSMIDLIHQNEIFYGSSPEIANNTDYTKIRKTPYEKLRQAQTLLPQGLHFCIYEGYRSLRLQKMLFDNRFEKVNQQHSDWTKDQIFTEMTKFVSPVINHDGSKNTPPHLTGGAINVYLIDDKGLPCDMGIHPKGWMKDDGSISLTSSQVISAKAKKNRKIMSNALSTIGFVNYLTEYWHCSYGDCYWAYHKNELQAIDGSYTELFTGS